MEVLNQTLISGSGLIESGYRAIQSRPEAAAAITDPEFVLSALQLPHRFHHLHFRE